MNYVLSEAEMVLRYQLNSRRRMWTRRSFVKTMGYTVVAFSVASPTQADVNPEDELALKLRRLRPPAPKGGVLPATGLSDDLELLFLKSYSPEILWDSAGNLDQIEALVTPSFFVQTAESLNTKDGPVAEFATIPEEKRAKWFSEWVKKHQEEGVWLDSPGERGGRTRDGAKGHKQESTKSAIKEHSPCAFGFIQTLGDEYWSIQYWVLFAFNNALHHNWHHEGDWICIDIIVKKSEKPDGPVVAAFYHNHGKIVEALPRAMQFTDADKKQHPLAYLEAGTNEPWPLPGDDGDNHHGTPGLYRSGDLGGPFGLGDEFGIRPHQGTAKKEGYALNIGDAVVNIRDHSSIDAQMVLRFTGRWGGTGSHGKESPLSPMYNNKMGPRDFGEW